MSYDNGMDKVEVKIMIGIDIHSVENETKYVIKDT